MEHRTTVNDTSHKHSSEQESEVLSPSLVAAQASIDRTSSDETTENTLSHVKALREQIQHMKLDIAKRKAKLVRRRKEIASAGDELSRIQSTAKEQVEGEIKHILQAWENLHNRIVEQRLSRSTQAARLFSLQQYKGRKETSARDIYSIGFTPISDLRELNSISIHSQAEIVH